MDKIILVIMCFCLTFADNMCYTVMDYKIAYDISCHDNIPYVIWYEDVLSTKIPEPVFESVIPAIIKCEGYTYVHDKSIREVSKMGITLGTYRLYYGYGTVNSIKNLTIDEATKIYKHAFWEANNLDSLADMGYRKTSAILLDSEINLGPRRANKFFQMTLGMPKDKQTGYIGSETLQMLKDTELTDEELYTKLLLKRKWHYMKISRKYPVYAKYMNGWNRRMNHIKTIVEDLYED